MCKNKAFEIRDYRINGPTMDAYDLGGSLKQWKNALISTPKGEKRKSSIVTKNKIKNVLNRRKSNMVNSRANSNNAIPL